MIRGQPIFVTAVCAAITNKEEETQSKTWIAEEGVEAEGAVVVTSDSRGRTAARGRESSAGLESNRSLYRNRIRSVSRSRSRSVDSSRSRSTVLIVGGRGGAP